MRTLVISDLHLGNHGHRDVLRRPAALSRLIAALDGVDRLVLLGDTLEYHGRHAQHALRTAEPVLRAIGAAMAGGEIVVLPGNHDHDLIRRWLRDRGDRLGIADLVPADASPALARVVAALGPARVSVRYPGVWISDRVWATHGHYVDRHLRPESAIGHLRRRRPARIGPPGYERSYRRLSGQRRPRSGLGRRVAATRARVRALILFGLLPLLMRPRVAPLIAGALDHQMRHNAIPAIRRVIEDLGVRADHVVFGHVHRLGPVPADDPAPWVGPPAVLNSGSWQYEALLAGRGEPPHPYWPGGAVLIEDGRAPVTLGLLDAFSRRELDPGRGRREGRPATVGGTCPSCSGGPRP